MCAVILRRDETLFALFFWRIEELDSWSRTGLFPRTQRYLRTDELANFSWYCDNLQVAEWSISSLHPFALGKLSPWIVESIKFRSGMFRCSHLHWRSPFDRQCRLRPSQLPEMACELESLPFCPQIQDDWSIVIAGSSALSAFSCNSVSIAHAGPVM